MFLRVVGGWYRRQAQALGHDRARWGSVTFVQRFGSSLNLNPHVHVLMLDGVYVDGEDAPVFVPVPPLSDQAVQQIVQTSARRIIRLCTKRGLLDDTAADPLADEEPVLAALTAARCKGPPPPGPLLEKLAALVPPPRFHLLRYHGVLAPRARDRIVPAQPVAAAATVLLVCGAEIGRKQLQTIPLGIFSVFRNIVGALFFLGIGLYVFGLGHFSDIFSPLLWGWMLLYGGVVVACGQLAWFAGIKRVRPADIATASSFSPVAGVLFAALILGEVPMPAQLIGGGIILVGIAIALWGELRATRPTRPPKTDDKAKAFTGV